MRFITFTYETKLTNSTAITQVKIERFDHVRVMRPPPQAHMTCHVIRGCAIKPSACNSACLFPSSGSVGGRDTFQRERQPADKRQVGLCS